MRALAIILNIPVVGLGHVLVDRHLAGFLHFLGFAICLNGVIIGAYIWQGDEAFRLLVAAGAGAALMWLYSMGTLIYQEFVLSEDRVRVDAERHYVSGLRNLFQGLHHDARIEFRAVLDLDPVNVPARMMIALAYREEHKLSQARKLLKECLRIDRDKRWAFEIQELLDTVQRPDGGTRRVKTGMILAKKK